MRFSHRAGREAPEINFIPLIDVLLVILIFLMVTTTYSRFAELQINLPTAEAGKPPERVEQIDVVVDAAGNYLLNKTRVAYRNREAFSEELRRAAAGMKDPVIVIDADAQATHQAVIRVMEAAQAAGYSKVTFTTQSTKQ
jgi:biopolymer transport protein ExbD